MPNRWHLNLRKPRQGGRFLVRRWPTLQPWHGSALSSWQREQGRNFPWRGLSDPFLILVAEMLLRKTAARQVATVFPAIQGHFGSPSLLASADLNSLRQFLRPLGFATQRARSLQHMAKYLMERFDGRVPADPVALQKIPHVGPYTANAVCCFAFGLPLPIVDTNVVRVLDRFTGRRTKGKRPYLQASIWKRALRSLPPDDVGAFNLGLLDLAALLCRPNAPDCDTCPLKLGCAHGRGYHRRRVIPQTEKSI